MACLFPSLVPLGRWQRLVVCLGIIAGLGLASSRAYGWGSAAHATVADALGSTQGLSNYQEIYGGMALDTFNFGFDPYSIYMAGLLHADPLKVWNSAQSTGLQALPVAFGFMTHNEIWGADYTAHYNGMTYGQGTGYVIAKANLLQTSYPLPPTYEVPLELQLVMAHLVVETAVDVLLKQIDPLLGQKITQAALLRPPEFPALLVDAYAQDLVNYSTNTTGVTPLSLTEATDYIFAQEGAFRNTMVLYGQALDANDPVPLLAGELATLAQPYLGSLPLTEEQLAFVLSIYIDLAMDICGPDFAAEIAATSEFVGQQLQLHGITAVPLPPALWLFGSGLIGLAGWRRFRKS